MTDPVVTLEPNRVFVEPGGQAQVTVTISNPGSIVEGYQLTVLGDGPSQWADVLPPEVAVYPQQQATAIVVFSPPSGTAAPGGEHAFGVLVRSAVDPSSSSAVEGDIEIGKKFGLQAKIVPVTSAGRWRGRHVVQLSNWGNSAARLRLVASDPDAALGFYVQPDVVDLPLGGTATVRMSVRTRKPFLRGTPVRLPFQVVGEQADAPAGPPPMPGMAYGDASRPVVDAAFTQKPILSRFVVTAFAVLLVAALAGVIFAWNRPVASAAPEELTDFGVPTAPQEVTATPIDSGTITVGWAPVADADAYEIVPVEKDKDGAIGTSTPAAGNQRQANVPQLAPGAEHCFRVVAKKKTVSSVPSEQVCATTPAASPSPGQASGSPSASPTGSAGGQSPPTQQPTGTAGGNGQPPPPPPPTDGATGSSATPTGGTATQTPTPLGGGKWVAFAGHSYGSPEVSQKFVDDLLDADVTGAQVVTSEQYPRMTVGPAVTRPGFFHAVVGPFNTREEAVAACTQVESITEQAGCVVGQPEPPQ